MHRLRLQPAETSTTNQSDSPDGPFPFPVPRAAVPAFRPRLASDSIANVEAALAQVERNFAELRAFSQDNNDRPKAA